MIDKKFYLCYITLEKDNVMKKKILLILLAICMLATATGCSCTGTVSLDFSSGWNESVQIGYSETLTYKGTYNPSYSDLEFSYAKSDNLTDDVVVLNNQTYTNATYVVKTEVVPKNSFNLAQSDILDTYNGTYLIKVSTTFSVDVNFILNKTQTVTAKDTSNSVVYLCQNTDAFAPIYSKAESTNTILTVSNNYASTALSQTYSEFTYNLKKYTAKTSAYLDGELTLETEKTYKYTQGEIIDNNALLFVLRNLELPVENSRSFKIPALAFRGKTKNSGVKSLAEKEIPLAFGINGADVNVKTNCYQIGFSGTQSGISKLCYYQTEQAKNADNSTAILDRNYLIRFIEILPVYGDYGMQGSLVFNLSNIA